MRTGLIPRSVIRRQRAEQGVAENIAYYRASGPLKPNCIRCGEPERDHLFGDCPDEKGRYIPRKPVVRFSRTTEQAPEAA